MVRRSHICMYLSSDIYYGHAYKEAIQLVFLLHSSQSPQQSEENRKGTVFKQFNLSNADICDGEDYIIVIS